MNETGLNLLKNRIFNRAALATIGTFVFNTIGIWLGLYSIIWWYDMPLHFFGGLFTGLLAISFFLNYKIFVSSSTFKTLFAILFVVLIVGLLWEGYEIFFDIISNRRHIFTDSLSDIFFDLAGGLEACFIYFRHKKEALLK